MNMRLGLFRLWLVAVAIWIPTTAYIFGEQLCSSIYDSGKRAEPVGYLSPPLMQAKLEGNPLRDRMPSFVVVDCLPSSNDTTIAWRLRGRAFFVIFGVPLVGFLLGTALMWAFAGFSRRSTE